MIINYLYINSRVLVYDGRAFKRLTIHIPLDCAYLRANGKYKYN